MDLPERLVTAMDKLAGRVTLRRQAGWLVLAERLMAPVHPAQAQPPARKQGRTGTATALMEACLVALRGPNR